MSVRDTKGTGWLALGLVAAALGVWSLAAAPNVGVAAELDVPAMQEPDGKAIYTGKGLCSNCHGPDGKGTALGPDLTDDTWLNIDGSEASILELVKKGVLQPKEYPAPMPPMGGAVLTDEEVAAVAKYVDSLSP